MADGPQRRNYWISIALTSARSLVGVNVITNWPLELALAVNCSITALFIAPAAAKISKFVNTLVPLMLTLKIRDPADVQKVSAKCSLTAWLDPATKPGMVYVKLPIRPVWYTAMGAGLVTPLRSMVLA